MSVPQPDDESGAAAHRAFGHNGLKKGSNQWDELNDIMVNDPTYLSFSVEQCNFAHVW